MSLRRPSPRRRARGRAPTRGLPSLRRPRRLGLDPRDVQRRRGGDARPDLGPADHRRVRPGSPRSSTSRIELRSVPLDRRVGPSTQSWRRVARALVVRCSLAHRTGTARQRSDAGAGLPPSNARRVAAIQAATSPCAGSGSWERPDHGSGVITNQKSESARIARGGIQVDRRWYASRTGKRSCVT